MRHVAKSAGHHSRLLPSLERTPRADTIVGSLDRRACPPALDDTASSSRSPFTLMVQFPLHLAAGRRCVSQPDGRRGGSEGAAASAAAASCHPVP